MAQSLQTEVQCAPITALLVAPPAGELEWRIAGAFPGRVGRPFQNQVVRRPRFPAMGTAGPPMASERCNESNSPSPGDGAFPSRARSPLPAVSEAAG